jgi:hypothetical protein
VCQKPSVNILFIKHKLVCLHQVDHLFIDSLGLIGFSRIRTVQSKLTCRLKHVKKKIEFFLDRFPHLRLLFRSVPTDRRSLKLLPSSSNQHLNQPRRESLPRRGKFHVEAQFEAHYVLPTRLLQPRPAGQIGAPLQPHGGRTHLRRRTSGGVRAPLLLARLLPPAKAQLNDTASLEGRECRENFES